MRIIEQALALIERATEVLGPIIWFILVPVIGLLLSWAITQRAKRIFPKACGKWSLRVVAFLTPVAAVTTMWPGELVRGFWIGAGIGIASPILYDIAYALLSERFAWVKRLRKNET